MKRYLLLLLVPSLVFAFGSGTIKKIDQIENNTGTDIVLKPASDVKIDTFTGNFVLQSGSLKEIEESTVSNTELSYLSGTTSNVQNQIDSKTPLIRLLTTTAPMLIDGGASADLSADRTISIPVATSIANGYLSSTDWTTFNDKSDYVTPNTTNGDLIYYNTGDASLAIGTAGQLLTVVGGFPSWQDAPVSVSVTTKGDIQGYTTIPARLAVGTNGQILSANSGVAIGLEWIDAPSGGGGVPLMAKGSLLTSTGLVNGEKLKCLDTQILQYNDLAPDGTGIECVAMPTGGGGGSVTGKGNQWYGNTTRFTTDSHSGLASSDTVTVIISESNNSGLPDILRSTNNKDWTAYILSGSVLPMDIVYNPIHDVFVVVGRQTGPGNDPKVWRSVDGITWNSVTGLSGGYDDTTNWEILGVDNTTGRMIMMEDINTTHYYSDDGGLTWTSVVTIFSNHDDLIHADGIWIGVATSGQIMRSIDGITWTNQTTGTANLGSIAYGDGHFVIGSQTTDSIYLQSTDGLTWKIALYVENTHASQAMAFCNGSFVSVGAETMISRDHGTSWSKAINTNLSPPSAVNVVLGDCMQVTSSGIFSISY